MSKSKSKSKKSANAGSNAKNIKALISQNKMIEAQNAEAEQKKLEKQEARLKAKQEAEIAKTVEADEVIVEKDANEQPVDTQNENVADTKDKKAEDKKADAKSNKNAKNKKQVKEKRGVGKRIKETVSELKKVSWPSFKNVIKKTGVVLAVVIFFGVCLFAFDFILSMLYNLLQGKSIV